MTQKPIMNMEVIMYRFLKQTGIFILTAGIIAITGCSKESNPVAPVDTPEAYIWVHFEGDSVKVEFDDVASFDVNTLAKASADENTAIWLKDFIDTSSVGIPTYIDRDENQYETRNLYAYRITGEDGFSASNRGYPDNIWEHMSLGYMFYQTRDVVFPKTLIDLAGAYNVKATRHIYVNRKLDVVAPDTTAFYRLCDFTPVMVDVGDGETEEGVSLKEIIESLIESPENYTYTVRSIDGFAPSAISWEDFQSGYYMLEEDRARFLSENLENPNRYRVRVVESILVQ